MIAGYFTVVKTPAGEFDKAYSPLEGYPVQKAAALYAGYAAETGGTKEAMDILSQLTPLTQGVIEMATKKAKTEVAEKPAKAVKAAKPAAKAEPKAKAAKAEKPAKAEKAGKPSAAAKIRELIMEGMSNEKIFAKMVKDYGFDDSKKNYPQSYRKQMIAAGQIAE
jgi:glucan-binding YG repeat protein